MILRTSGSAATRSVRPSALHVGRLHRRHYQIASADPARSPLAFAFDIDGVLLHGKKALPAAKRALHLLDGNNARGLKIPYILMTNGGGVTEDERSVYLSKRLGVTITPKNLVQAHTVLRPVASACADEPILVLGGVLDRCRKVAESYGFRNVYIPTDYLAAEPGLWPFYRLSDEEKATAKPDPPHPRFIMTFHDPRNWALDIQLVCDLLTHPTSPPPKVVFCNPDLLWRSDYPRPRFGQGAFKEALSGVYRARTGKQLDYLQFGKPKRATYEFAESMLMQLIGGREGEEMPNVYMVGDNPASDIDGANAHGWQSILVRTGVYDPAEGPPAHTPTHEAADVAEAVDWALRRELGVLGGQLERTQAKMPARQRWRAGRGTAQSLGLL